MSEAVTILFARNRRFFSTSEGMAKTEKAAKAILEYLQKRSAKIGVFNVSYKRLRQLTSEVTEVCRAICVDITLLVIELLLETGILEVYDDDIYQCQMSEDGVDVVSTRGVYEVLKLPTL